MLQSNPARIIRLEGGGWFSVCSRPVSKETRGGIHTLNYSAASGSAVSRKGQASAKRILIEVASYRDPQLVATPSDLWSEAKRSNALRFGVCRRYDPRAGFDEIATFRRNWRFRSLDVPCRQSFGACSARSLAQWEALGRSSKRHIRNGASLDRMRQLLRESPQSAKKMFGKHDLGKIRRLRQHELYAGISFSKGRHFGSPI